MVSTFLLICTIVFPNFDEARAQTAKDGKPLMVLLTADWCQPCKKLKKDVIEPMNKDGELDGVNFSMVYIDKDQETARKLMLPGKTSIPQIIYFFKKDKQWFKTGLVGAHPDNRVMREQLKNLIKMGTNNE